MVGLQFCAELAGAFWKALGAKTGNWPALVVFAAYQSMATLLEVASHGHQTLSLSQVLREYCAGHFSTCDGGRRNAPAVNVIEIYVGYRLRDITSTCCLGCRFCVRFGTSISIP